MTVQQRSRVAQEPTQPKLRQVHLIPVELHDALQCYGLRVGPGSMGENITKREVALLALPRGTRHAARGTRLHLGPEAVADVDRIAQTQQPDTFQDGMVDRDAEGRLVRKAG